MRTYSKRLSIGGNRGEWFLVKASTPDVAVCAVCVRRLQLVSGNDGDWYDATFCDDCGALCHEASSTFDCVLLDANIPVSGTDEVDVRWICADCRSHSEL